MSRHVTAFLEQFYAKVKEGKKDAEVLVIIYFFISILGAEGLWLGASLKGFTQRRAAERGRQRCATLCAYLRTQQIESVLLAGTLRDYKMNKSFPMLHSRQLCRAILQRF